MGAAPSSFDSALLAPRAAALSCPASNNTVYRAADGATYSIECYFDRPYGDITHVTTNTMENCISLCESATSCIDVAFYPPAKVGASGTCWEKNAMNKANVNKSVWNARKLTPKTTTTSSTSTKATTSTSSKSTTTTTTSTSTSSACSATPTANSGKRGLGYNDPTLTQPFSLNCQNSKVSWGYNWGSQPYYPGSATASNKFNPALTYVPMLWSNATVLTSIWNNNVNSARSNFKSNALLGFNEPDLCQDGSACMSVDVAVGAWKTWMEPFAGQISLVSPAVSNSGASGQGLSWLSSFVSSCSGCHLDAIALHWYGNYASPSDFTTYVSGAYQQFGKPIWITEFGTTSGTPDQVQSFLKVVLPWLDSQAYVKRYAYFMDSSKADQTWLINGNGTGISDVGRAYNTY